MERNLAVYSRSPLPSLILLVGVILVVNTRSAYLKKHRIFLAYPIFLSKAEKFT